MDTIMAPPATHQETSPPPLDLQLRAEARSLVEAIDGRGICSGSHDNRWFAQGMTRRKARILCGPCPVPFECLRLAVLEEALAIHAFGGSVHDLHGARGGVTGRDRSQPVKELVERLKADASHRR